MISLIRVIAATVVAIFVSACAGIKIGGRTYDRPSVEAIRNVAIVGLEIVQPQAFDPMKPSSKIAGDDTMMGNFKVSLAKPEAEKMPYYKSLNDFLKSDLKWVVLPLQSVVKNPAYHQLYKSSTEGWQSQSMHMTHDEENFAIPDLMDVDAVSKLEPAKRDELMRTLNVDALVVQRFHVVFGGTVVLGMGSFKPKTILSFQVYKRGVAKPVWENPQAEGEAVSESVGKTRLTVDMTKVDALALTSAKSAYDQLLRKRE